MTPTTKAELLAAVTANQAEIEQLVPQLKGIIGDREWRAKLLTGTNVMPLPHAPVNRDASKSKSPPL